jgi:WD40 repeat protein
LVAIAFLGCFGTSKGLHTTARPAVVQPAAPSVELPRVAPPPPEVTERARANPPRVVPQIGHTSTVTAARYSRDGRFLVSASYDASIKLWDVATGALIRSLSGYTNPVKVIALLPDDRRVLAGTDHGEIDLWNLDTGARELRLEAESKKFDPIESVVVAFDGQTAISVKGGKATQWDLASGKELRSFDPHGQRVHAVAFTPGGPLAITAPSHRLEVYNLETGKQLKTLPLAAELNSVRFSRDGTRLVVAAAKPPFITVYDAVSWRSNVIQASQKDDVATPFLVPSLQKLVTFTRDRHWVLWDLESGRELSRHLASQDSVTLDVSPDGRRIVLGGSGQLSLREHALDSGEPIRTFDGSRWVPSRVAFSRDGETAIVGTDGDSISIWNVVTGALAKKPPVPAESFIRDMAASADGKRVVSLGPNYVRLWDFGAGRYRNLERSDNQMHNVSISADGSRVAISNMDDAAQIWDFGASDPIATFSRWQQLTLAQKRPHFQDHWYAESASVSAAQLTQDGWRLLWVWQETNPRGSDHLLLSEISDKRLVREYKNHGAIKRIQLAPDGRHMVTVGDRLVWWNLDDVNPIRVVAEGAVGTRGFAITPDGLRVLTIDGSSRLSLRNLTTSAIEQSYDSGSRELVSVAVAGTGTHAVTASRDGSARLWNLKTGQSAALVASGNEWLIYTDDGYFDASRRGGRLVSVVSDRHPYQIDQLAVRNNRPDIILSRLGLASEQLIAHFAARHRYRLQQMGIDERALDVPFAGAPELAILGVETAGKKARVTFEAKATYSALERYQVWVNEVPIFGHSRRALAGQLQRETVEVELTAGQNRVEISARARDGVESLRDYRVIDGPKTSPRDLYVLAFGVSQYKNPQYNLVYSNKDATDLARVLRSFEGHGFDHVHATVLVDQEVTVDAIRQAKARLTGARPDDTLVVFVAGHGLHARDATSDYYFLTHEADLAHLPQTAARFELIEDLVQDVAPRQKLLLLDTCNSGDLDPSELPPEGSVAGGARGIRARSIRALTLVASQLGSRQGLDRGLLDRNRYIYHDLVRRSGALVFSSSQGREYSYETDELQNGVFTQALLNSLTSKVTARRLDGWVSTDELVKEVSRAVALSTRDAQHPTMDHDNSSVKFGFPVVEQLLGR